MGGVTRVTGAQHSSSRLSLWRPAPQEKLLLCVNVAAPEKRSRPAHGWKGRPRNWQRSARWYQAFCFFFAGTRRSLVPHTTTKTIFFHTKTKISRTHTDTDRFFLGDVSIRNSLRWNKYQYKSSGIMVVYSSRVPYPIANEQYKQ